MIYYFNIAGSNSAAAADDKKEDKCISDSMRLWVGVDAEWRPVILPIGKEAKLRDKDKKEKHSNAPIGAATLQVCTVHLYLSSPFPSPFPFSRLCLLLFLLLSSPFSYPL